jgi:hypothetical protein
MSERTGQAFRAALVGTALLGLLALVALASRGGRPAAGSETDLKAVAQVRDVVLTLAITLWALMIVALVWALRRFGSRDLVSGGSPMKGLIVFFAVVAILWLVVATADGRRPLANIEEFFDVRETQSERRALEREGARKPQPAEFEWEIAVAVIVATAAAMAFLILRLRREAPRVREGRAREDVSGDLVEVIEGTLDELRGESDPRRAVIAAYAQLERTLTRHRLPRVASEAPFEYLARILRELRVRASAVLALTELFERARFSLHTIDETMKREAIEALAAVRDDLKAPA